MSGIASAAVTQVPRAGPPGRDAGAIERPSAAKVPPAGRTWLAWAMLIVAGCRPAAPPAPDVRLDLQLVPSPPTVGHAEVTLKVADSAGQPVRGADVRLEGNMNHAGMVPTFAGLEETGPGTYTGTLEFTMGGDWFILATVIWPDGRRLEQKLDVPGVQAR